MLFAIVGVALVSAGLCVAWLVPKQIGPAFAVFPAEQLEVNSPQFFRPFDMGTDPAGRGLGIWLVRLPGGEVRAFWSKDPHFGDAIEPVRGSAAGVANLDEVFRSARAGPWAIDGHRIGGPAHGLHRFEVELDADLLTIDLTHIVLGECSPDLTAFEGCSVPGSRLEEKMQWPRA